MRRRTKKLILKLSLGVLMTAVLFFGGLKWYHYRFGAMENTIGELRRIIEEYSGHSVRTVCAGRDLKAGVGLVLENLEPVEISDRVVPQDAVTDMRSIEGRVLRIPVSKGTIISESMLAQSYATSDTREVEYECIAIDDNTEEGSVVDVRIYLPDGTDYVVISKTRIMNLDRERRTVRLNCREEEILLMESALTDQKLNEGSRIYLAGYVEETLQRASVVTYRPSKEVAELLKTDPNIGDINKTDDGV